MEHNMGNVAKLLREKQRVSHKLEKFAESEGNIEFAELFGYEAMAYAEVARIIENKEHFDKLCDIYFKE